MLLKEFYLVPEEVFRVGNSEGPLMSKVRGSEVDTYEINGIRMIRANGKGVSLYNAEELLKTTLTGWVWKFASSPTIPHGLVLVNDRAGHYHVAPQTDMPVDKYKGLLEEFALKATKEWKKVA